MTNIFGIPDYPVGDGTRTDSVRSRYSANLFISYPSVEHWRNLYDPHELRGLGFEYFGIGR